MQPHSRAFGSLWDDTGSLHHRDRPVPASYIAQRSASAFAGAVCNPENGLVDDSGLVLVALDWSSIPPLQRLPTHISGIARSLLWRIQPVYHLAQLCDQQHLFHFWSRGRGLHVSLALVLGSTGNHDHWRLDYHGLLLLLHPSAHGQPEPWIHLCHLFLPQHLLRHSLCLHT